MTETMTGGMGELRRREARAGAVARELMRQKVYIARHWDPAIFDPGHINTVKKWEAGKDGSD